MKRTIFSKIFVGYLVIIIVLTFFVSLFSFRIIRNHYINTLTDNLKNVAIALKPETIMFLEKHQLKELDALAKGLRNQIHTRITVINREGIVLADSEKDPAIMENHKTRPEVMEAIVGSTSRSIRFSVTLEEEMLYVAIPIEKNNNILGVLRMSLSLKQINSLLNNLKIRITLIAFIITIISLIAAFILSRGLSRPIGNLVNGARKLADGDFNVRIFLKNNDELKELSTSFNEMADKMGSLFTELSRRNEELDTIISSVQEALFVLDKNGIIKLSNDSFGKMLGNEHVEGRFYWEVLRHPDLSELIKKVEKKKRNFTEEIEFNDRIFLCSITFLSSKEEIIAILHDITEFKNLEKVKKDFIANISHELRTPLTAIKGFVETLEEEEQIKNVHYLEIIKRHTDRLMNIVRDLLLLSELEEKGAVIEIERVSLKSIIENILKLFEKDAKEKGLTIKMSSEANIPEINADAFKLEQIFINLIDNAIKYTERGEITISLRQRDSNIIAEIQDTGMGIPAEHLPRIFERFYVIDKSRSKKLGGTGLGLSIVKHIVLLHQGNIDVESSPGKGTKFIITLPL